MKAYKRVQLNYMILMPGHRYNKVKRPLPPSIPFPPPPAGVSLGKAILKKTFCFRCSGRVVLKRCEWELFFSFLQKKKKKKRTIFSYQ